MLRPPANLPRSAPSLPPSISSRRICAPPSTCRPRSESNTQFGKIATTSVTYVNSRGVHQFLSNNVNAFLPGTYDPCNRNRHASQRRSTRTSTSSSRAACTTRTSSTVNYSVRAKRVSLFGFYMLNFAKADTSGANYFPSNQFNPGADYGRANFDVRNRFLLGGNHPGALRSSPSAPCWWRIRVSPSTSSSARI